MKKEKVLKQKIAAIVLSLVLAVTTIIVPSVMSAKDVSAAEDNQTVFKNLMMSVMLSGNSEENFGKGKETVDDATAAY